MGSKWGDVRGGGGIHLDLRRSTLRNHPDIWRSVSSFQLQHLPILSYLKDRQNSG